MAKTKTSAKRKGSSVKLMEHDYTQSLKDREGVLETLFHCLVENDLEAFRDVLVAHLRTVSKAKLALETKLGRRTIYDLLDDKKPFNPSLRTLAPLLHSLRAKKGRADQRAG